MQIVNGVNEIVESIPKHVNNGIEMIMLIGIEIILIRILINTSFLFISLLLKREVSCHSSSTIY